MNLGERRARAPRPPESHGSECPGEGSMGRDQVEGSTASAEPPAWRASCGRWSAGGDGRDGPGSDGPRTESCGPADGILRLRSRIRFHCYWEKELTPGLPDTGPPRSRSLLAQPGHRGRMGPVQSARAHTGPDPDPRPDPFDARRRRTRIGRPESGRLTNVDMAFRRSQRPLRSWSCWMRSCWRRMISSNCCTSGVRSASGMSGNRICMAGFDQQLPGQLTRSY